VSAVAGTPAARLRLPRLPGAMWWGAAIVGCFILAALLAPLIAPYDPIAQDTVNALLPPGLDHPLGTDNFGRDVLSRLIWGTRIDLLMGAIGVLFPFVIGTAVGCVSGYFGGWVDVLVMRIVDIVLAFPFLVLMLAIIAILGPGLVSFYIALALVGWVSYARLVRAQVLILKASDFVTAARSLGYGHIRIMARHILPNAIVSSIVFSMSDVVLTMLLGASISYLGLGVQPPTAEWGLMVAESQNFIIRAWWIAAFPGVALAVIALGFSLLGDGLGEWLGVRE
jgi:peptide/nickel transport system permease protein